MNIPDPLLPLFDQGLLDEVLRPLMSGKEASVYLVVSRGERCVAKVYKDAQHRSFRQRAAYAEGRQVRNSRQKRAMEKGTGYGKAVLEAAWQNAEVEALHRLRAAGVRVPEPYHHSESVLLMELVKNAAGEPAPRLYDLSFSAKDAVALHDQLIRQVACMLSAGLVHGDLSEYNILMGVEGPVIIDFPQTSDAAQNPNSERLFLRDVSNLAHFLGRSAPELRDTKYGPEIWDLFARAELRPDSPLTGRFQAKVTGPVDAGGLLAELAAAAADAPARPMSAYQLKKQRRLEEARAAEAAEAQARAAAGRPERRGEPERRPRAGDQPGGARSPDRRQDAGRPERARGAGHEPGPRPRDAREGGRGGQRRGDAQAARGGLPEQRRGLRDDERRPDERRRGAQGDGRPRDEHRRDVDRPRRDDARGRDPRSEAHRDEGHRRGPRDDGRPQGEDRGGHRVDEPRRGPRDDDRAWGGRPEHRTGDPRTHNPRGDHSEPHRRPRIEERARGDHPERHRDASHLEHRRRAEDRAAEPREGRGGAGQERHAEPRATGRGPRPQADLQSGRRGTGEASAGDTSGEGPRRRRRRRRAGRPEVEFRP
jgi:RIO kinase 1